MKRGPFSYKSELKTIGYLFIPVLLSQLSLVGLSVTNTKIIASLGASAIAALGLSTIIITMLTSFAYTLLSPVSNFVSNALGQRDEAKIVVIFHQGLWVSILFGLFFLVFLFECDYTILPLMRLVDENIDEELINYSRIYLKGISFLFPVYLVSVVIRGFLDAYHKSYPTMYMSLAVFLSNIFISYVLVHGFSPFFKGLGIMGAGLALFIAYFLRLILMFIYLQKVKVTKKPLFKNYTWSSDIFFRIIKVGFPLAFTYAAETLILTGVNYLVVSFGIYVISGSQIAQNVWQVFYQIPFGLNFVIGLRISFYLGEQYFEDVKKIINLSFVTTLFVALINAFVIFAFRNSIALFFSDDPLISIHAKLFVMLIALIIIPDTFQSIFSSIQKAHNDTAFPMLIYLGSYFIFMPIAYFFTFGKLGFPKFGPAALYYGFAVSLTVISILLFLRHRYVRSRYHNKAFMHQLMEKK